MNRIWSPCEDLLSPYDFLKGYPSVQTVLTWLQLFLSVTLIAAVMIHPAKGMGLGSMGSSAQLFGSQKGAETGLNRITGIIAISWAVVAILLSSPLIK
jgi:protein translocase SecG subunit